MFQCCVALDPVNPQESGLMGHLLFDSRGHDKKSNHSIQLHPSKGWRPSLDKILDTA